MGDTERIAHRGLDFYTFINHDWQKKAYIEPFESTFSVSDEIEDQVEKHLFAIVNKLQKTEPYCPMSRLVRSILSPKAQHTDLVDLRHISNQFDCMKNATDVGAMIGSMNRIQSNAPISLVVANDRYVINKRCVYIYEPKLGLPEKHFYREKEDKDHVLLLYTQMLEKIGKYMEVENLESVAAQEVEIVKYLSPEDDRENVAFVYKSQTLHELESTYSKIPWRIIVHRWGIPSTMASHVTYVVTNTRYIEHLNHLFQTYPMDAWRTWMRAQLFIQFMKYLPPPFDTIYFHMFGKQLQGTTKKVPTNILMMKILKEYCPQALGHAYIENSVSPKLKHNAILLVRRLRNATLKRIENLAWMTAHTKDKAIEKCRAMLFQVAYPDVWKSELKHTKIHESHMLLNIWNLSTHDTDKMIHELKHYKINEKENWEDGVFEVNAYYYSDKNMMVIPAGILQPPFFDLSRTDAWNLGGIGAAIGHEITHGFDDDGRMYDKSGVMKNWWSDTDINKYVHVTKELVDLFNKATYMGGKVNGQLTLSENIADLGGVAIALEALTTNFAENGTHNPAARKKALQEFFTSYAVSWRNKDRPKKARQSLILDRHAPAPVRVNLIVRQFAEFYEAFDIGENDPGYIPPDKRIQLW
jgi:putative endopeptidase